MATTERNPDLSTGDDSLKKQLNSPLHSIDTTPKVVEETKSSETPRLKQEDQPTQENGEAVRKRTNSDLYHQKRRVSDPSKRVVRPNAGQDRGVERSPLHLSKVGEKGLGGSSSSLERKEGSHGSSSTPGRRLRSVNRGDEADESPAVPPFGGWDESNPAESDGYTQLFNRVREERLNTGGATPNISNGRPSPGGPKRDEACSSLKVHFLSTAMLVIFLILVCLSFVRAVAAPGFHGVRNDGSCIDVLGKEYLLYTACQSCFLLLVSLLGFPIPLVLAGNVPIVVVIFFELPLILHHLKFSLLTMYSTHIYI